VARWPLRSLHRPTRDGILLVVGLAGLYHETVLTNLDRPDLIIAFFGMIGSPMFLRVDERRNRRNQPPPPPPPPPADPGDPGDPT
jgi:hypothetical protein